MCTGWCTNRPECHEDDGVLHTTLPCGGGDDERPDDDWDDHQSYAVTFKGFVVSATRLETPKGPKAIVPTDAVEIHVLHSADVNRW